MSQSEEEQKQKKNKKTENKSEIRILTFPQKHLIFPKVNFDFLNYGQPLPVSCLSRRESEVNGKQRRAARVNKQTLARIRDKTLTEL